MSSINWQHGNLPVQTLKPGSLLEYKNGPLFKVTDTINGEPYGVRLENLGAFDFLEGRQYSGFQITA